MISFFVPLRAIIGSMKRVLPLLIALFVSSGGFAAPLLESLSLTDEVMVIINTNESDSGPSPILNSLGVRASIPFGLGFSFDPGISIWATYYDWPIVAEVPLGRALPVEIEHRTAWVIGVPLSLPVSFAVPLGESFRVAVTAGVVVNARIGLLADKVPVDELWKADSINGYFWGGGRFLFPETMIGFSYRLSDTIDVGLFGRALWPVFNLWNAETFPFEDGMLVSGGLKVTFRFDRMQTGSPVKAEPLPQAVPPAQ